MPTFIGHIIAGSAIGYTASNNRKWYYWIFIILLSILPDFDVILFSFGYEYQHPLAHRGFFHSLFFSSLIALMFYIFYTSLDKETITLRQKLILISAFVLVIFSHPFYDSLTNGGLGVGFLMPFENGRHFLPVRPIKVSPFVLKNLLSSNGWMVIKSELIYVGIPSAILVSVAFLTNFKKKQAFK